MKKVLIVLLVLLLIGVGIAIYWRLILNKSVTSVKSCGIAEPITYCSGEKICYSYCDNCECRSIQCVKDTSCQSLFENIYSEGLRIALKECGNTEVVTYCSNKLCSVSCNQCGCQSINCYTDSNCANKK